MVATPARRRGRGSRYIPDRGDAVWLELDPQAGHEQAGRRPALVLSPAVYNAKAGLALCCPITSQVKGYPFEVPLPAGLGVGGVVLADQVKSVDWQVRRARRISPLPAALVERVVERIELLLRG